MGGLLGEVQRLENVVIAESQSKRAKFEGRGQLLPRERVARLLDRGSSFLELSRLAGLNMHELIAEAAAVFSNAAQGHEGQEGIAAFLQKRKPRWAPA